MTFLRAGFYPTYQRIKKALIGWKKTWPPEESLLFLTYKQAIILTSIVLLYTQIASFAV